MSAVSYRVLRSCCPLQRISTDSLPWFATLYVESFSIAAPDDFVGLSTFGGGDARSAFGFRSSGPAYWAGLFATGPTAGASHANAVNGSAESSALLARFGYQLVQTPDASLHIGVNAADMLINTDG